MISQKDSSYNIEPRQKPNSHTDSILLGIALILGIFATVLSGFLFTQVQPLQQKLTTITTKVETIKPVVQNTDISGITKQISELDKIVRSQSTKLSSNDEAIGVLCTVRTEHGA